MLGPGWALLGSVQGLAGRGVLGCWLHGEEWAGPLFRAGGREGLLSPRALLFGPCLRTDSDGCRHAVFFPLPWEAWVSCCEELPSGFSRACLRALVLVR